MNKNVKINNLYGAAFLITKGVELTDVEKINDRKVNFIFKSATRVAEMMQLYNYAPINSTESLVDARSLITAIKTLKERLYSVIQVKP